LQFRAVTKEVPAKNVSFGWKKQRGISCPFLPEFPEENKLEETELPASRDYYQ
jgi:hypothetical protein